MKKQLPKEDIWSALPKPNWIDPPKIKDLKLLNDS